MSPPAPTPSSNSAPSRSIRPIPLFVEEAFAEPPKPWEARLDNVYPNVIYDREDEGRFIVLVQVLHRRRSLSNRTSPGPAPAVNPYGESEREEGLLYAILEPTASTGRNRRSGIIDFERLESEQHRHAPGAVTGCMLAACSMIAREPDPARRYKFIHRNASARQHGGLLLRRRPRAGRNARSLGRA